jgi:hypothetical protein
VISSVTAAYQPLSGQEPTRTQPKEHVVRRGDTLWDLAQSYLSNPFLWPNIFEANKTLIKNPHWIYPKQRFLIPGLMDSLTAAAVMQVQVNPEVPVVGRGITPAGDQRTRFYRTPAAPDDHAGALSRVEFENLEPYLVAPDEYEAASWLADTAQMETRGMLLRLVDPASAKDKLPTRLHPYDRVHIGRIRGTQPAAGEDLLAVRVGRKVNGYGRIVSPLAVLRVDSVTEEAVIARVVRQYADATEGDPVIALPAMPSLPRAAGQTVLDGVSGQIVEFRDLEPLYGTTDHAFISVGKNDGLQIGDELMAYLPESKSSGQRLASTPAAIFRVIRVEDTSATVRVMSVTNSSVTKGLRVQVVRKMQ